MSPKRWILLLLFYISYLMFGASIYYHLEHSSERQRRSDELKERIEINAYLLEQLSYKNVTDQDEILERISNYCGRPVTDYRSDKYEIPYTWTFYHSFFFAFTVCSTVGYGNISPTTTLGQMIMIAYSIIGIPVNGILFAGLGEYFGLIFQSIYHRYKKYKMSTDIHYMPPKLSLITTVLIALIPGITMFLLIPSWVFSYFENWPFSLALYYAYVTTTTIGFGDFVPTFQPHQQREFGAWFVVYQIFIIVWFIFSLGYLLMIMTFITRGLKSKKLEHLEKQLSMNIKATQNRIWSGVTKDVTYIRRLFNELYLMKYKPVYSESINARCGRRSISCPNLNIYSSDEQFKERRKRAASECFDNFVRTEGTPLTYNSISDTEMNKIDRQKSFETAEAFRQTTNLLFKVVDALVAVKSPPLDDSLYLYNAGVDNNSGNGYHGFSDSQILATELWSTNDGLPYYNYPRGRSSSDFNVEPKWQQLYKRQMNNFNEWTWSGDNNQIQEAINKRYKQNNKRTFNSKLSTLESVINMESQNQEQQTNEDEILKVKRTSRKSLIPDSLIKWIPFKRKNLFSSTESDLVKETRSFSAIPVPEHISPSSPSTINHYNATISASVLNEMDARPSTNPTYSIQKSLNNLNDNTCMYRGHYECQQQQNKNIMVNSLGPVYLRNSVPNSNNDSSNDNSFINIQKYKKRRYSNCSNNPYQYNYSDEKVLSSSRRPSTLSFVSTSQNDADILETTTLADLIRALENMRYQSVIPLSNNYEYNDKDNEYNKLRKEKNVSFEKSLLALFNSIPRDNKKSLTTANNRLYERRSTVAGNMSTNSAVTAPITTNNNISNNSNITNILTRRRRCTTIQTLEPPPNYDLSDNTYKDQYVGNNSPIIEQNSNKRMTSVANSSFKSKCNQRFSITPANLQTPLGQTTTTSAIQHQTNDNKQTVILSPTSSRFEYPTLTVMNPSKSFFQRRFSLRPSPLAQTVQIDQTNTNSVNTTRPTRYLPPHVLRSKSGSSTSTHSPLSRIVQISQAHRKSSMPDGLGTTSRIDSIEQTKFSD